jgi:heme o synthase
MSASLEMTTATQRAGALAGAEVAAGPAQRARDYVTLTKPHIISLLLVTTLVPMLVAAQGWPGGWLVLATLAGGYLMAGSANAANMYVDRDIDALMARTRLRPIPAGRMSPGHVLAFSALLGSAALLLFATVVNGTAAALAAAGWIWYVAVYTLRLKRTSPQNIVVGGAAGAFPPLVGWAAVTGSVGLTALVCFLVVFLWTPPHFWALALVKQREYGRVGVPMAPNVWGERRTLRVMVAYTWALVPVSLLPAVTGGLGPVYGGLALLLGAWFLLRVHAVARAVDRTAAAWRAYRASLLYLALLFGAMAVDVLAGGVAR